MKLTKKMTYPAYPVDIITDVVLNDVSGNVLYRNHSFDRPDKLNHQKKWQKQNFTHIDTPLHGQQSLRPLYYHVNESKIPATVHMGIQKK